MASAPLQTAQTRMREAGRLPTIPPPQHRRLKVFSLDPSFDIQLDNTLISRSVLSVPWEQLKAGPVGEYVEVVDIDPSSGCAYDPVDLSHPDLLAQDGLSPSTGNPQFHQQMVYAVAMKTIANFERVLGRQLLWAERRQDESGRYIYEPSRRYVQRLRIYPHALRDQNAYYSPSKAALLFGYFNAATADPRDELPRGVVFTCLSHDIVAHETTHAILDGMHRRMLDPSNPDMIAFHEAFADIVAIFQHFTLPGLLLDQIQRTRGNLMANNLLARLAAQFARATGQGDALRNALGSFDEDGRRERPDPSLLSRTTEPHDRGAILVAAVFDAFVRMYENRVADLRRIATGGTGVLPDGDIHPDLARRFADEASRLAQRVLNMCIRAVDYLPPVDVTYGDFLRAVITADADFYPEDPRRYRLAFIEAFRDRGIYPLDVPALGEDALRWSKVENRAWERISEFLPPVPVLRTMAAAYDSTRQMEVLLGVDEDSETGGLPEDINAAFRDGNFRLAAERFVANAWQQPEDAMPVSEEAGARYGTYLIERMFARFLHKWIANKARDPKLTCEDRDRVGWHLGLDLDLLTQPAQSKRSRLEVHAVRPTVRIKADGRSKVELLIVLTQKVRSELVSEDGDALAPTGDGLSFLFRGGATLIVDPEQGKVTYAISKSLRSQSRKARTMAFLRDQLAEQGTTAIARFGLTDEERANRRQLEPFALAHSNSIERGVY